MPRTRGGARCRPRGHRSRGQALVEFALILPITLLLAAAAIDVGRLFFAYVTIENAAKEGALYGASRPQCDTSASCPDPSNVVWHLSQDLSGLADTSQTIACLDAASGLAKGVSSCASGDTYRVTVAYRFSPITPIAGSILGNTLTLRSSESALVLNPSWVTSAASPAPVPSSDAEASPSATATACIAPHVSFSATPTTGAGPYTVTFTGTSDGTPTRWQWDFGDGGTKSTDDSATTETVTHTYAAVDSTQNYDVALTVNTGATCSTTATQKNLIQVKKP